MRNFVMISFEIKKFSIQKRDFNRLAVSTNEQLLGKKNTELVHLYTDERADRLN